MYIYVAIRESDILRSMIKGKGYRMQSLQAWEHRTIACEYCSLATFTSECMYVSVYLYERTNVCMCIHSSVLRYTRMHIMQSSELVLSVPGTMEACQRAHVPELTPGQQVEVGCSKRMQRTFHGSGCYPAITLYFR
jgi:hypothetical protein